MQNLKALPIYIMIFACLTFIHYHFKAIYHKNCACNIFYYYFFKDSNMCVILNTYIALVEKLSYCLFSNYSGLLFKISTFTFQYLAEAIKI